MTKRINKWTKEYVIQEYTELGWEDSTSELNMKDLRVQMKLYRENAGVPVRWITRRVINPEWQERNQEHAATNQESDHPQDSTLL